MVFSKRFNMQVFLVFTIMLLSMDSLATDFYVDPTNGSMQGDGSANNPWSTMQEVWVAGKIKTRNCNAPCSSSSPVYTEKFPSGVVNPGDTIYLKSGNHGTLSIIGAYNTDWITVKAAPGQTPTFRNIKIVSAAYWVFDGVRISPSYYAPYVPITLFLVENHSWTGPSHYITLRNSTLFGPTSIDNFTAFDWSSKVPSAIHTEADHSNIESNTIYHINNGIESELAPFSVFRGNIINHLCGDGIQINEGSDTIIEYNTIKNVYTTDGGASHKDMIQFWTFGDPTNNAVIRGNRLILTETPDKPFTEKVQGIGIFDGLYNNILIENNLIITNTDHGITVQGSHDGKIINNTVVTTGFNISPNSAPIRFWPQKGTPYKPGSGNVIANNFSNYIDTDQYGTTGGVVLNTNNITSFTKDANFTNPLAFDFSLKRTSSAVDTGDTLMASHLDIIGQKRDNRPDIGAYEYSASPSPVVSPKEFKTTSSN